MLKSLTMFLAPAAAHRQVTPKPPPAAARPAPAQPVRSAIPWRLAVRVITDAVGFAALLTGCWLVLQLMQALLTP
jgi:hypothetical protein